MGISDYLWKLLDWYLSMVTAGHNWRINTQLYIESQIYTYNEVRFVNKFNPTKVMYKLKKRRLVDWVELNYRDKSFLVSHHYDFIMRKCIYP